MEIAPVEGLAPIARNKVRRLRLEHGLLLGASLICIGIAGDGVVLGEWARAGFGALQAIRAAFFFSLSLFVGVEVVFSSIFLSMLGISRDTYIGE